MSDKELIKLYDDKKQTEVAERLLSLEETEVCAKLFVLGVE